MTIKASAPPPDRSPPPGSMSFEDGTALESYESTRESSNHAAQPISHTTTMADRSTALLEHIVSRVEQDVQFLVDQNYITAQDAAVIVARLPSATRQAPAPISSPPLSSYAGVQPVKARALWAYNENGKVCPGSRSSVGCMLNFFVPLLRIPMTCLSLRVTSLKFLQRPMRVRKFASWRVAHPHTASARYHRLVDRESQQPSRVCVLSI